MAPRRWQVVALHLPLFLLVGVGWMVALGLALALWVLASGEPIVDADRMLEVLGAGGIGAFTIVQMGGLAALAAALALFVTPDGALGLPRTDAALRLGLAFPLRTRLVWLGVALVGGLTVWTLPSFIAQELLPLLPDYPTTGELLDRLLRTAPPLGRSTVVLAIVASAPLFEELVFRGYLWRVFEASFGGVAAWIGTTLLFALFHMDPVQSVALLPIALLLGWLRWVSGSIVPSIGVHLLNNGLGVALTLASSASEPEDLSAVVAFSGAAVTGIAGALGVWLSRRVDGPVVL